MGLFRKIAKNFNGTRMWERYRISVEKFHEQRLLIRRCKRSEDSVKVVSRKTGGDDGMMEFVRQRRHGKFFFL
jgi:hypothetical protein